MLCICTNMAKPYIFLHINNIEPAHSDTCPSLILNCKHSKLTRRLTNYFNFRIIIIIYSCRHSRRREKWDC